MEPMTQEHMQFMSDLVVVLVLVSPFVTFLVRLTWEVTGWFSDVIYFYFDKLCDWIIKQFE